MLPPEAKIRTMVFIKVTKQLLVEIKQECNSKQQAKKSMNASYSYQLTITVTFWWVGSSGKSRMHVIVKLVIRRENRRSYLVFHNDATC